jgi:hypothetical protein
MLNSDLRKIRLAADLLERWDMARCRLVNSGVSEELAAFILGAQIVPRILG